MSDSSKRRVVGTPSTSSVTVSTPPAGISGVNKASPSIRLLHKASSQAFSSSESSTRYVVHSQQQQQQHQRTGSSSSPIGTPSRPPIQTTSHGSNLRARLKSHTAADEARSHARGAFQSPTSILSPVVTPVASNGLSATTSTGRARTTSSAPQTESPTVRVRPPLASHAPSTVSPASPRRRVFVANTASNVASDGSPGGPSFSLPRSAAVNLNRPPLARSTFASRNEPIRAGGFGRSGNASPTPAAVLQPAYASPSVASRRNIFQTATESPVPSAPLSNLTASRPGSPIRRATSPVRPPSPSKLPISTSRPTSPAQSKPIIAQPPSPVRPVRPPLCISPQRQPTLLSAQTTCMSPPLSPKTSRPSLSSQSSYTTSTSRSDAASVSSATTSSPDPQHQQHDLVKSASQASFATIHIPPRSPSVTTRHVRSQSQTSEFSTLSGNEMYKQSISTAQRGIGIRIPAPTTFADLMSSPPKVGMSPALASYAKQQADAKVNRKILDLEITNTSLLAINASLEKAKVKQAQELRDLRRTLRDRTIGPPSSSLLSPMSDASPWPRLEADVDDDFAWEDILAQDAPFIEAIRAVEAMTLHAKNALEKTVASENLTVGGRVLNQYNLSRSQLSIPGDMTDMSRRTSSASEMDSMMVHKPDISMVSSIGID